MNFQFKDTAKGKTDQQLLDNVKAVADELGKDSITVDEYDGKGKYSPRTLTKRIGIWGKILERAGLRINFVRNISLEELYKNIEDVWIRLGTQPTIEQMTSPLSKFSGKTYQKRFGSWTKALQLFVEYINSDIDEQQQLIVENVISKNENVAVFVHKTSRNPTGKQKIQVLARDGNKCRLCGITLIGTENMHFDHIKPWSKGGETTIDNLQILCTVHNQEKGNLDYT